MHRWCRRLAARVSFALLACSAAAFGQQRAAPETSDVAPPQDAAQASSPAPVGHACLDLPGPSARGDCIAEELQAAEAEHRKLFAACKERVAPALRPLLISAESNWKANLEVVCEAEALPYEDADERRFFLSLCKARAARQRTEAMLDAHPECAPSS